MKKKKIAVFASGSGTNLERIANYFAKGNVAEVAVLVCNRQGAGVTERAQRLRIPVIMIDKNSFSNTSELSEALLASGIDLIVLAGFLWLVPEHLLHAFPKQIINIHPALLPQYGGKGMYGQHVHEAVIRSGEKFSGITIHFVNEKYDEGDIIFQESIAVRKGETAAELAARIHQLEYKWFPKVIESILLSQD